jgi:hypothetical protein
MELILFRPDDYASLYNCTGFQIEAVPFEQRQHVSFGIALILMAVIYFVGS